MNYWGLKMTKGYPDRAEAEKIWEQGMEYRRSRPYGFASEREYKFHSRGVGEAAGKIAEHIPDMDSEKAFVMGLLHDYGKRIKQSTEGIFHGKEGYDAMLEMGYPDVAQICLTHTFPDKDFNERQFTFAQEWKDWAREKLKSVEYTNYDFLIAFCDKLFEEMQVVSVEGRVKGIVKRYNLGKEQKDLLLEQSLRLKEYIDKLANKNVYEILGIDHD